MSSDRSIGPSFVVATIIDCDLSALVHVDARTVDALARLQLAARRRGCRMRLRDAPTELLDLLELMGLSDVLLRVEPVGQAEQREHGVGVEEERELDDPAV
jgi:ABC-type transporter Mla MlaB component